MQRNSLRQVQSDGSDALPEIGFLRLPQVLKVYPVSKSTWWNMVREGRAPKPVKLGPRTTAWKAAQIRELVESVGGEQ